MGIIKILAETENAKPKTDYLCGSKNEYND